MTTDPSAAPVRDMSARVDIDKLLRDVPVVNDLKDFEIPGFFESDEELDEFLAWSRAERDAHLA